MEFKFKYRFIFWWEEYFKVKFKLRISGLAYIYMHVYSINTGSKVRNRLEDPSDVDLQIFRCRLTMLWYVWSYYCFRCGAWLVKMPLKMACDKCQFSATTMLVGEGRALDMKLSLGFTNRASSSRTWINNLGEFPCILRFLCFHMVNTAENSLLEFTCCPCDQVIPSCVSLVISTYPPRTGKSGGKMNIQKIGA